MPAPKWKGSPALQKRPDSPEFNLDKNGPVWTYTYEGPYSACLTALPKRLQALADAPGGFLIDRVNLKKAPGGRGVLTVTLCQAPVEDQSGPSGKTVIPEMEWVEVVKKLETHPRYNDGGVMALTDTDRNQIEGWRNETDMTLRTAFKFNDNGATTELSTHAKDFAGKLLEGTDSWVTYAPVARLTTKSSFQPTSTGCGKIDLPPPSIAVANYVYRKSADHIVRQDREWQRVEEWMGAEQWDIDLYESSSEGG